MVEQHRRIVRQDRSVDVFLCVPEVGAHERLGTVQECLLDRHDQSDLGCVVLHRTRRQQPRVVRDAGSAIDAERLVHVGHKEENSDAGRRAHTTHPSRSTPHLFVSF